MIDSEIRLFLVDLRKEFNDNIALNYLAPVVPKSGHALELESSSCLGTISIWDSGNIDWHIFDIHTLKEALLGSTEVNTLTELRKVIFDILQKIKDLDARQ